MIPHILRAAAILTGLAGLASLAYYALCMVGAYKFLRTARKHGVHGSPFLPPISILKPMKGADPGIYESLRSHCLQDYPEYEIIFGVSAADDPAVGFVERLRAEFPHQSIRLVICGEQLGTNGKVSNLAYMVREARHEFLLVNDSDIRVNRDYLRQIVAPLQDAKTGMVTCLYRGVAANSLGSRLEALGISTDFAAGVLTARLLEGGIHFGLGSTLAFRRGELQAIDGFEALVDYLGDDYELGRRIADLGLHIELSDVVVDTFLPAYSLREFFQHQLRWARNIRDSRRGGYVGLGLTFGIPWGLAAVVFSVGALWAWILLGAIFALRAAVGTIAGWNVLHDRQVWRDGWMIPLRDCVGLGIWVAGFAGHTIVWRGERFILRGGKLSRS